MAEPKQLCHFCLYLVFLGLVNDACSNNILFGVAMKVLLLILVLFSFSGCCGWFSPASDINVKVLEGTSEYPYQYIFTRTGSSCGEGPLGSLIGSATPVFFNFPEKYQDTLVLQSRYGGKINLSIPTSKIEYKDRDEAKFVAEGGDVVLKGGVLSFDPTLNRKGILVVSDKTLRVNIINGEPFIEGSHIDKLGYFKIYNLVDMKEYLDDGSSNPLKFIELGKGQKNSFFNMSDKVVIFKSEDRKKAIFTGVYSDLMKEGKLLSIYLDSNIIKGKLYGVVYSTLLNKQVLISIGASQSSINGSYTFD